MRHEIPRHPRSNASASPTGPAPTISTSVCWGIARKLFVIGKHPGSAAFWSLSQGHGTASGCVHETGNLGKQVPSAR